MFLLRMARYAPMPMISHFLGVLSETEMSVCKYVPTLFLTLL